jgi:hypothetical protein
VTPALKVRRWSALPAPPDELVLPVRKAWSEQRERKAAPQPELLARQVPPAKLVRKE